MAKEPTFVPKAGQVDYTNIRYCPVVNCVAKFGDKILVAQRSLHMRLYPGYWNGISGFLDDQKSVEDKVREELQDELGLGAEAITAIKRGNVLVQEAEDYHKTWIVFPVLAEVNTGQIRLDWEAATHRWLTPAEARKLDLLPGFDKVLDALLP